MPKISPINFTLKTGEKVIIRSPEPDDFEAFADFMEKIQGQSVFVNQYPGAKRKDYQKTIEQWKVGDDTKENVYFLAFYGTKVMGMISGYTKHDHPWLNKVMSFGMMLDEPFWGKGLGSKLLELLIEAAEKAEMHRIEAKVRTENYRGLNLYLKHGFQIEGLHRKRACINGKDYDSYTIAKIRI